jgi:hypothetical protein
MNEHLSKQQVMDWLCTGPTAEQRAHVENCRECEAKLAELAEPIAVFRTAATALGERKAAGVSWEAGRGRRSARAVPAALAWAGVLLMIVAVSVPVVWRQQKSQEHARQQLREGQRPAAQATTTAVASHAADATSALKQDVPVETAKNRAEDALLLEQVDDDVSRSVPQAMAPLTVLVSWSGTSSESETIQDSSTGTAAQKTAVQKD